MQTQQPLSAPTYRRTAFAHGALQSRPRLRQVLREIEAVPIIEGIGKLIAKWQEHQRATLQSLLGRAMSYTQNLWPMLRTHVQDGRVEIDNSLVENAICFNRRLAAPSPFGQSAAGCLSPSRSFGCPTAVGKKNWLFIGEANAGHTSAILFTIIKACRRQEIDPWRYLREVLTRLPTMKVTEVGQIKPEACAKAQRKQVAESLPSKRQARAA